MVAKTDRWRFFALDLSRGKTQDRGKQDAGLTFQPARNNGLFFAENRVNRPYLASPQLICCIIFDQRRRWHVGFR